MTELTEQQKLNHEAAHNPKAGDVWTHPYAPVSAVIAYVADEDVFLATFIDDERDIRMTTKEQLAENFLENETLSELEVRRTDGVPDWVEGMEELLKNFKRN